MSEPINPYESPQADDSLTEPIPAETALRQAVMCHVTEDDLLAWTTHFINNAKVLKRQRRVLAILLGAMMIGLFLIVMGLFSDWLVAAVICVPPILFGGLVLLMLPSIQRRSTVRLTRQLYQQGNARNLLGDIRFEITPAAFSRETRYGQSVSYWQGIESIEAGDEHLFVVMAPGSAYVVPYRDFEDAQHRDAFLAACQRYQTQAQELEVPLPSWAR